MAKRSVHHYMKVIFYGDDKIVDQTKLEVGNCTKQLCCSAFKVFHKSSFWKSRCSSVWILNRERQSCPNWKPGIFLFSYLAFSVHSSAVLCWSNVSKQNIVFSTWADHHSKQNALVECCSMNELILNQQTVCLRTCVGECWLGGKYPFSSPFLHFFSAVRQCSKRVYCKTGW